MEADVKIFQGSELKAQLTLPNTSDDFIPVFRATSVRPEIGATYDLRIELPDNEVLSASTTLPGNIQFAGIEVGDPKVIPPNKQSYDEVTVESKVLIDDAAGMAKYFHIAEVQLTIEFIKDEPDGSITVTGERTEKLPVRNIEIDNQAFTTLEHEPGFLIDGAIFDGSFKFLIGTKRLQMSD